MRKVWGVLIVMSVCAFPSVTVAQQTPKVNVELKEMTLKNGLRVITVEDHHAPVVSLVLMYKVGGANEREGRGELPISSSI